MAAKPAPKQKPAPKTKPAPAAAAPAAPAKEPKAKKEAAPKAPKVERVVQNDVTRPKDGSATGTVWEIADALSKQHKRPATRAEVFEANAARGNNAINEATVATQYQRWRVFNGVEKSAPAPKAEKAPKAPKGKKAEAA